MERTGVAFCSVRAIFGTGECLISLVPLADLTSLLIVAGGFATEQVFMCIGEVGAETTWLEGTTPVREFPFGNSLCRAVVLDCSNGFTCLLG